MSGSHDNVVSEVWKSCNLLVSELSSSTKVRNPDSSSNMYLLVMPQLNDKQNKSQPKPEVPLC